MKSDRKYFIEHLTCFVSRARQSGGVETIRSFSVTKQLPPLVPTPSNARFNAVSQPIASTGSTVSMGSLGSHRGSASSGSFGVASSDGFLTQDSDAFSGAPTTGESFDHHDVHEIGSYRSLPFRTRQSDSGSMASQRSTSIAGIPRLTPAEPPEQGYNLVNRKPALRKWLAEDESAAEVPPYENSTNNSFDDRSRRFFFPESPVVELAEFFEVCVLSLVSWFQARMGTRFFRWPRTSSNSGDSVLHRRSRDLQMSRCRRRLTASWNTLRGGHSCL